ncbi:EF-hand domain-containing protein, partial [Salmonella sp. s54412]|uniref:EF-hand domain-containing protein n=1 Tax=Salmonella sp. s54412 TaxID=3160128 RepID=UPI0037541BDE
EIFNGIDQDDDGFVSLDEYLGDAKDEESNSEPPKWREDEKEIFSNERDMDKDGKLNREEALKWLFPGNYDPLDSETSHLFSKADDNKDKILTK